MEAEGASGGGIIPMPGVIPGHPTAGWATKAGCIKKPGDWVHCPGELVGKPEASVVAKEVACIGGHGVPFLGTLWEKFRPGLGKA